MGYRICFWIAYVLTFIIHLVVGLAEIIVYKANNVGKPR